MHVTENEIMAIGRKHMRIWIPTKTGGPGAFRAKIELFKKYVLCNKMHNLRYFSKSPTSQNTKRASKVFRKVKPMR